MSKHTECRNSPGCAIVRQQIRRGKGLRGFGATTLRFDTAQSKPAAISSFCISASASLCLRMRHSLANVPSVKTPAWAKLAASLRRTGERKGSRPPNPGSSTSLHSEAMHTRQALAPLRFLRASPLAALRNHVRAKNMDPRRGKPRRRPHHSNQCEQLGYSHPCCLQRGRTL